MSELSYGGPPDVIGSFELECPEYMQFMYLPVIMPGTNLRLPRRLDWTRPLLAASILHELFLDPPSVGQQYVYVTAKHGYAVPGNPLNRPGWHADGFGSQDINYVWCDAMPTRFAVQKFTDIPADHITSVKAFEEQIRPWNVRTYLEGSLLRLDPTVVHATPDIKVGGPRTWVKISFSPDKYNLYKNSHNYLFDYDWKMWRREEVRNDPSYAGGDSGPQESHA